MKNIIGRDIPEFIEGIGKIIPYKGQFEQIQSNDNSKQRVNVPIRSYRPGSQKLCKSLKEAIEKVGVKNDITISFHHHMRDGDETDAELRNGYHANGGKPDGNKAPGEKSDGDKRHAEDLYFRLPH